MRIYQVASKIQISVLKRKTLFQPTGIFCTSRISWKIISDWLPNVFLFGTENWEEQFKKHPVFWMLRFRICVPKGGKGCFRPSYRRPKLTLVSKRERKSPTLRCHKKHISHKWYIFFWHLIVLLTDRILSTSTDRRRETKTGSKLPRSQISLKRHLFPYVYPDLEFVKKFTRPNFQTKEFYTLKTR